MMNKPLIFLLLCSGFLFSFEIVRNGQPAAMIVLPERSTVSAQLGAEELRHHVRLMTGAELPIVRQPAKGINSIILGISAEDLQAQEYFIEIRKHEIRLGGIDHPDFSKVDYQDCRTFPNPWKPVGTLYAVYDFLEMLGIRWYLPTELGIVYDRTSDLAIAETELRRRPSFEMRWIGDRNVRFPASLYVDTVPHSKKDPVLAARECELWFLRQRNGGSKIIINHSLGSFYERFKDKKKWFAQGYAKLHWDSQLCFTNPEVIAQAVKDARDYFDGKVTSRTVMGGHYDVRNLHSPDVYSMVPMDHGDYCKCSNCQALLKKAGAKFSEVSSGDKVSNLFFTFVNKVAREVKKTHPGKTIAVLSYADYAYPPDFRLEDNIMVEFCVPLRQNYSPSIVSSNKERLKLWQQQYPNMKKYIWGYYCWPMLVTKNSKGRCFPGFMANHVKDYFKDFRNANITGMFWEASNAPGTGLRNPLFDQLAGYINWKLAWNIDLDPDRLFEEFFRRYYGPAEKPMKEFYLMAESIYNNPVNYARNPGIWATYPMSRFVTPERQKKLAGLIGTALKLANAEPYRSRVQLFDRGIWQYITRELQEEGSRIECMQQETVPFADAQYHGDPGKVNWNRSASLIMYGGLRAEPLKRPLSVRCLHDGRWLYLQLYEHFGKNKLRINELGMWRDDEWELFFARQRGTPYHQMGICSNKTVSMICQNKKMTALPFRGKIQMDIKSDFWTTTVALPLMDLVPGGITPGNILYFNILRAKDLKCSACYIPTFGQFRVPERFGELYLAPKWEPDP